MVRCIVCLVCAITLVLLPTFSQTLTLEPLRFASGAVVDFHLQTHFNPDVENEADLLPKGTILRVRLLSPVDSDRTHDGSEIRAVVTEAIVSGGKVVVHADAEAQVLFVVLRNRTHPQGFRYELLVTRVTDRGKPIDLTASLSTSFADIQSTPSNDAKPTGAPVAQDGVRATIISLKKESTD